MDKEIISLDELRLNSKGIIHRVNCEGVVKRRLLDLGLVEGTEIKPILISPLGDLRAFFVRGTIIAIRKEEAKNVTVQCNVQKCPATGKDFHCMEKTLFFHTTHCTKNFYEIFAHEQRRGI